MYISSSKNDYKYWVLFSSHSKEEIKEILIINNKILKKLTEEILVNPSIGKGLAGKVIKCIDLTKIDRQNLVKFISSLTHTQILKERFYDIQKSFALTLFDKFQQEEESFIISLIFSISSLTDIDLNQILAKAIEANKMTLIKELLKKDFAINANLFALACRKGIEAVVCALMQQNKRLLNVRDDQGLMPLMYAITEQQERIALELIKMGAGFLAHNKLGELPIHMACINGMEAVVFAILERSAFLLDAKTNKEGMTPLLIAILNKRESLALKLIEKGADTHIQIRGKLAPIHLACQRGLASIISRLLRLDKEQVHAKTNDGLTPLMVTLIMRKKLAFLTLIEGGADVGMRTPKFAPIHLACEKGLRLAVNQILKIDKDQLEVTTDTGLTPLMVALDNRMEAIAFKLIDLGADLRARDHQGFTPIHFACLKGMEQVSTRLIQKDGRLINITTHDGLSPLLLAISNNKKAMALKLIEQDADLYIVGNTHKEGSAIHLACRKGWASVVTKMVEKDPHLLMIKNKDGFTPLMLAIVHCKEKTALKLIDLGANIEETYIDNYNSLHLACIYGTDSLVTKILEKDPRLIDILSRDESTPLNLAHAHENHSIVLKLMRMNLKDFTAIHPLIHDVADHQTITQILRNNIQKILDFSQNAPGANPLKVAFLIEDQESLAIMKEKLEDSYYTYLDSLKGVGSKLLERMAYKINPTHFVKGTTSASIDIETAFELPTFLGLFDAINFKNKSSAGYKDPAQLFDEGNLITLSELRVGMENLIKRVRNRESYMGTPPPGTPEIEAYYDNFERLLKNLGHIIAKLDDPSEKASHLIDIAIMGNHCGGKIGEAANMYHLLNGQLPKGFEVQLYDALRNYRLEIIKRWAIQGDPAYEVHRFNHYMFLLGKILHLPQADTFMHPDPLSGLTHFTQEEILLIFYKNYTPSSLIEFTKHFILDAFKEAYTRESCIDWLKDNVPSNWQREKYEAALSKIRKLEEEGISRPEIREIIKTEHHILFTTIDLDLKSVIRKHCLNLNQKVEEGSQELYLSILEIVAGLKNREDIKKYLQAIGITLEEDRDFENLLEQERCLEYLTEVFKMDEDYKVIDIDRLSLRHLLRKIKVIF